MQAFALLPKMVYMLIELFWCNIEFKENSLSPTRPLCTQVCGHPQESIRRWAKKIAQDGDLSEHISRGLEILGHPIWKYEQTRNPTVPEFEPRNVHWIKKIDDTYLLGYVTHTLKWFWTIHFKFEKYFLVQIRES